MDMYDAMTVAELKRKVVNSQHPDVFGYLEQSHVPRLTKGLLIDALKQARRKPNPNCVYIYEKVYGMTGPVVCKRKKK